MKFNLRLFLLFNVISGLLPASAAPIPWDRYEHVPPPSNWGIQEDLPTGTIGEKGFFTKRLLNENVQQIQLLYEHFKPDLGGVTYNTEELSDNILFHKIILDDSLSYREALYFSKNNQIFAYCLIDTVYSFRDDAPATPLPAIESLPEDPTYMQGVLVAPTESESFHTYRQLSEDFEELYIIENSPGFAAMMGAPVAKIILVDAWYPAQYQALLKERIHLALKKHFQAKYNIPQPGLPQN